MRLCAKQISLISISISLIILSNSSLCLYIPQNRSAEELQISMNKPIMNQKSLFQFFTNFGGQDASEGESENMRLNESLYSENSTKTDFYNASVYFEHGVADLSDSSQDDFPYQFDENTELLEENINLTISNTSSRRGHDRRKSLVRKKRQAGGTDLHQEPNLPSTITSVIPEARMKANKPYQLVNTCPSEKKKKKRTLGCYQCNSTYLPGKQQKDELCDNVLWGLTSAKEKYIFRMRCPEEGGSFCVKKIQEIAGKRVTLRGCMGPGPIKTDRGDKVTLKPGCVEYRQNNYITTTCLCQKDMCNAAVRTTLGLTTLEGFLHILLVSCMSILVYFFSVWVFQIRADLLVRVPKRSS